jgi:hypothetical protein
LACSPSEITSAVDGRVKGECRLVSREDTKGKDQAVATTRKIRVKQKALFFHANNARDGTTAGAGWGGHGGRRKRMAK